MALAAAILVGAAGTSAADPVRGNVRATIDDGFARLVFKLDETVVANVRLNWPILVITFRQPVNVAVDRLNAAVPGYVSAARIDPDGSAIRIALSRKVKLNTIPAAERLYIDLLPEDWTGVLPGLPPDVVEELSQRAREADRLKQRNRGAQRQAPTVLLKVASQPTFTRYVFDLPDGAGAVPETADGTLKVAVDRAIKWDIADAVASLPQTLQSVSADTAADSSAVTFVLKGKPDVRTFREDASFIVDVSHDAGGAQNMSSSAAAQIAQALSKPADEASKAAVPVIAPAEAVPAAPEPAASDDGLPPLIDVPAPASAKAVQAAAQPAPEPAPKTESRAEPKPAPNAARAAPKIDPQTPVNAAVQRADDTIRATFAFAAPVPAAAFMRADTLWLVFDTPAKINVSSLAANPAIVRSAVASRGADGEAIVRVKLKRPQLVSLDADGANWNLAIGDTVAMPPQPLSAMRSKVAKSRPDIVIPFEDAARIHHITDPDLGDGLIVVTGPGPARGFLKPQSFVELRALGSVHGVAVHPIADDVTATLSPGVITLSRPSGLSLSSAGGVEIVTSVRNATFDPQTWNRDRKAKFEARQSELIRRAAAAPPNRRQQPRLDLARFYLARGMAAEARAVIDVARSDTAAADDVTGSVLSAVTDVMMHRPENALKELSKPGVGKQIDVPVWRAIAYTRQGKWAQARESFKNVDAALAALPVELQRMALIDAVRSNVEAGDFSSAARLVNEFETLGVSDEVAPSLAVLTGRVEQGLGRSEDALASYKQAIESSDRRAAAEGRLREIELRLAANTMPRKEAITALETLTTVWRGDETETEGLKLLAHLYTADSRFRDAFHVMRTALLAHPNSELTRQIQDEAATTFESLFLSDKSDALPPIEALGLFYDYRELTPIGRRGDEMIRRLADRLVAVDLLDQAAELLQHQVDNRLQGAARAQIAAKLAVVYLMDHKPQRALSTLRTTRASGLAGEIREERLLLEARALSETGRHDLALEVIADIKGREAIRLRADILWAGKRWRAAAEQIELLYGERWKQFTPLAEGERFDILRAAVAYSLAEEALSLERFREKYAAKMADGPDARAFAVVTAPIGPGSGEFQNIARWVAGINTLDAFLRDMRARYPDTAVDAKDEAAKAEASKLQAAAPKLDRPPASAPAKPEVAADKADRTPTGSIGGADR